jgi:hypothetical protein
MRAKGGGDPDCELFAREKHCLELKHRCKSVSGSEIEPGGDAFAGAR